MHSYEQGAARTAAAALRILNGEKPSDIKNSTRAIRIPEIRLATNAALGDQRE